MKKNLIIYVILVVFLATSGLFFGYYLGSSWSQTKQPAKINKETATFQDGWEAAKKRLIDVGWYFPIDDNDVITSVSGQVVEFDINKRTLKVNIDQIDPFYDPGLDIRNINIDDNTKIYQTVEKEPVTYQQEIDEYNRKIEVLKKLLDQSESDAEVQLEELDLPQPNNKKEVELNYLKQGQQVSVEAGEDIKKAINILAIEILIGEN